MLIVDLSSNNPTPNFKVLAQHVQGVWIKATEGVDYTNPDYAKWAMYARHYGLRVGAYHFARPTEDAVESARKFCKTLTLGRRDLRPALDFETWNDFMTPAQHETWARTFNNVCRELIKQTPIFYTYGDFADRLQLKTPIGDGLWEAAYGRNDGKQHPFSVAHPWKRVVAHQFTSRATVLGCPAPVDLSYAPHVRGVLANPVLGLL